MRSDRGRVRSVLARPRGFEPSKTCERRITRFSGVSAGRVPILGDSLNTPRLDLIPNRFRTNRFLRNPLTLRKLGVHVLVWVCKTWGLRIGAFPIGIRPPPLYI